MLTRFVAFAALLGAFFSLSVSPSFALTEAQQDAAIASLQAAVASLQSTVATQAAQIADLQKKTNGITVATDPNRTDGRKYTEMTFKYLNLHILNGLGATNGDPDGTETSHVNGLGNVIIGYNAARGTDGSGNPLDVRTGSHNLIVGDYQNYSSFGGMVGGQNNTVSGPFSSVGGGYGNTASGYESSVSGGYLNTASGFESSVSGGQSNTSSAQSSSISGGVSNMATGLASSISGGQSNTANITSTSISGGYQNTASGLYSSISGGYQNTASGKYSAVSAGKRNQASGDYSAVSGGQFNTVSSTYAIIGGGLNVLETISSGFAAGGSYSGSNPGPGTFHSP